MAHNLSIWIIWYKKKFVFNLRILVSMNMLLLLRFKIILIFVLTNIFGHVIVNVIF